EAELDSRQWREQDQWQAGRDPVREHLAGDQRRQRGGREGELLEAAVGMVGSEQARQSEQAREQRRDPGDARRDLREQDGSGLEPERGQAGDQHEKDQDDGTLGARAHGERAIAAQSPGDRGAGGHEGLAPPSSSRIGSMATGRSRWVAQMASPPPPRWAPRIWPNNAWPLASSAVVGSSSSHSGRWIPSSRASPSRRLCPAERRW